MSTRTRDAVIADHVAAAMRHSRLSYETFAQAVGDLYHERTPDTQRGVRFHPVPRTEPYAAMRANAQLLRRYVEGPVRMPVELEESIVLALPEPFLSTCRRELAMRYGLLAAEQPEAGAPGQGLQLAALLQSAGDSVAALAPMFDDFVIDHDDAAHAPGALAELEQLMGTVTTMIAMIRAHAVPTDNVSTMRRAG